MVTYIKIFGFLGLHHFGNHQSTCCCYDYY